MTRDGIHQGPIAPSSLGNRARGSFIKITAPISLTESAYKPSATSSEFTSQSRLSVLAMMKVRKKIVGKRICLFRSCSAGSPDKRERSTSTSEVIIGAGRQHCQIFHSLWASSSCDGVTRNDGVT